MNKNSHTELSALIERRPVDATNPLDRFDPDSIIANSKDKEEVGGLLDVRINLN